MNILLAVPQKDNSIQELNFFLSQDNADLYIFPEGFLDSNVLQDPEVARIMCLDNPVLLINIIGTGMYHNLQFEQWTSLAKARAIENEVYVIGCSHFAGEIPLAYVFDPSGKSVLLKRNEYGGFIAEVDLGKSVEKIINYYGDRLPNLFSRLAE